MQRESCFCPLLVLKTVTVRVHTNVPRAEKLETGRAGVLDDVTEPPNKPEDCPSGLTSLVLSIACCPQHADTCADKALFTWPLSQGFHLSDCPR